MHLVQPIHLLDSFQVFGLSFMLFVIHHKHLFHLCIITNSLFSLMHIPDVRCKRSMRQDL